MGPYNFGRPCLVALLLSTLASVPSPTLGRQGGAVIATLTHPSGGGTVGCALFHAEAGFPDRADDARGQFVVATGATTTCRWDDVPAGRYAVAAFLDTNANKENDRNFLGMPTEPWGVSKNARPSLRAPRFDEAAFDLAAGQQLSLDIRLEK